MKCEIVQDLLITNYLDSALSYADEDMINAHLEVCSDCQQFKVAVKKIPSFAMEIKDVPETLWPGVKARVEQEKVASRLTFPKFFLEAACAAAILVIIYSFYSLPLNFSQSGSGTYVSSLRSYLGQRNTNETGYDAALSSVFNKG